MGKIGITCRQPFLGADEWIAEEIKKLKEGVDEKPKSEEKAKPKESEKQKKTIEVKEK